MGVMYANNFTRRPFTDGEQAALVTLADHAAVAVEKARLLAAEHAARAEAESASRGKDELLAMLGHELRNPLSAIATADPRARDGRAAREELTRRAHEIIARQNAHLAHLVDDLLDVARVTSGKIALVRRPLELGQAVRHSLAALAASGKTERHRVDHGPRAGLGRRGRDALRADRQQPRRQRAPLHAGRAAASRSACAASDGERGPARPRQRGGDRARDAVARLRSLRSRASAGPTAARAAWGSASPWSAASPSCTAAAWTRRARAGARQHVHGAPARARRAARPRAPGGGAPPSNGAFAAAFSWWRTIRTRARCCATC